MDVRELSGGPTERLGVPPGCPGVVGRPSRMSGSGRESLPDVREWLRGPPGCPEVVERPYRMSGSGGEDLPDVWQGSGDPPG